MKFNSNSVRKIIAAHIFLVLVFLLPWSLLKLPWAITFIFDLLLCIEFVWAMPRMQSVMRRVKLWHLIPYTLVFLLYLFLTQLISFTSPGLAILAYRRSFRFLLFYLACIVLLKRKDIDKIMKLMMVLQVVNAVLTLYQYFVMKLTQDYLGGIFGVERGANAYSNTFLCAICTYMIVMYLSKKVKLLPMLLIFASSLLIAALAELKIFFIEIVLILLLAVLFSRASVRAMKIVFFSVAGLIASFALFAQLFPEHAAILMNWKLLLEYTTESIHGYNISRLSAFSEINRIFFKDNVWLNLFGYGFGNCESGSAFYEIYGHYNYTWFTHQVTFLETGYVGVILYALFYVMVYIHARKSKKQDPKNAHYYTLTQIICLLTPIWFMYNQSMRIECAYLIFFLLAIPAVIRNERENP